jgi:predicted CXXCH cytochrome family protein
MFLLVAGVFLLSSAAISAVNTADTQELGCKECHENIYKAAAEMVYEHSVVTDNCGACHILSASNIKGEGTKSFKSSDLSEEVLLYLKGLPGIKSVGTSYLIEVEASDRYGRLSQKETLNFKPTEIEDAFLKSSVRPVFDKISVDNISVEGIFPEATISWETNVYATTTLEYGLTLSYGSKAFTGKRRVAYYKKHVARLPELKRNKTYHFRITARDVSGRLFKSRGQSFTTKESVKYNSAAQQSLEDTPPVIEGIKLLRSAGGKVGVVVASSKPVRVTLNARENKSSNDSKLVVRHGAGLTSPKTSRVDVCVGCHNQGISHPVSITANTRTTRVPTDLPTLPGGIITCNTCHYPHGGNLKFFARIDFEDTTMCAQCHTTEPFI